MSAVEQPQAAGGFVGQAIPRVEDPPLIRGEGTYVDDVVLPGMLHAAIVRSTEAHARIVSIDASEALARDDVHAVLTSDDLSDLKAPLPMIFAPPGVDIHMPAHWPLAKREVKHVGDPVAVVLGDDRYTVADAAEQVVVEYEPLPAVVDPEAALEDGSPLVHEQFGTNKVYEYSMPGGDIEAALADADLVVERKIVNHRTAGTAIEPRGVVAEFRGGELTLWSSTQIPHVVRMSLSAQTGIGEDRIRVIAPDVGGGFGSKLNVYGEETLMAVCARKVRRPVKWIESRSENLAATTHGRAQIDHVKVGVKRDGTLTGIHAKIIQDCGAQFQLLTPFIPLFTGFVMSGCYRFDAVQTDIVGVFTNTTPTDAVRGAGRPEATHILEVMMDQVADELGMDRLELRRKNFIPADSFPAEVKTGLIYDSGNYEGTLARLLEHLDLDAFRSERAELREQGIYRGIGFSTYMEMCGLAPSRIVGPSGVGLQAGFWESALVRVHPTGSVTVFTGTSPHGQGLDTSFAQIVADRLGVTPDDVDVIHGDTSTGPFGMGTYGSRSLAVGGESIVQATDRVVAKAKEIAAHMLEASVDDIEVTDGKFAVRGSPEAGMSLADIAVHAYVPEKIPEGMEPGLESTAFYDPENFVFPFGAHAAIVDVDVETGKVRLVRYVAVDDCGPPINPMIIDGQVHGGIVHAVGQALYEQVAYGEDGQLLTPTFVEYALPTAAELPSFETDRTVTPSPTNALGVKGVGEAGTIAATPAVLNAVVDALKPLGVSFINMPLTPMRVFKAIEEARS
jgi:carbon-monoxide dehydrogenase large subunit